MKLTKFFLWLPALVFAGEQHMVFAQGAAATVIVATEEEPPQDEPAPLTIGDDAPAIDVEHWVQDGGGRFKPVTEFEPGNVYIIEFWATWCKPCIASMPHISALQEKLADQGVQVVSISDEPLETVTGFLARTSAADPEKTYGDITANYCLTTDPDRSEHAAYMEAAGLNGVPRVFLVGKDGKLEWIGHPMAMDKVVEQVVADAWNREAFRKTFELEKKLELALQDISRKVHEGRPDEAYAMLDAIIAQIEDEDLKKQAEQVRVQLDVMVFQRAVANDQKRAAEMMARVVEGLGGTPAAAGSLSSAVVRRINAGKKISADLAAVTIEQLEAALNNDPGQLESTLMLLLARVLHHTGETEQAVEVMQRAIEVAPQEQREELKRVLGELSGAK